jgi:putative FmdB family regulatory protein
MPTYDYQCQACDHQLEAFHSMSAEPLKDCPSCGKPELKRLIGPGAGLLFKGSGFYQTDYRSDSYKKAAEKESSSPKEKKTTSESTSSSVSSSTPASTKSE